MVNKEKVCKHCNLYPCKRETCDRRLIWKNHKNVAVSKKEYDDVNNRILRLCHYGSIPLNYVADKFMKAGVSK